MGRRREERAEKMLCCVQSQNEMREKQCVAAYASFCGRMSRLFASHIRLMLAYLRWESLGVHTCVLCACTCIYFYVITYETAACWRWKPPDGSRQSRCSCQSVSLSHW